jgi:hypothetical protein
MRPFLLFMPLALMLSGCSYFGPTLKAQRINTVLRPNRLIEEGSMWGEAEPLLVTLHNAQLREDTLPLKLRAVHDGQSLSILAEWPDRTPIDPYERSWILPAEADHYFLREFPPDTFSLKFALSGADAACMMTGKEGDYDLWHWRAGWSNIAGYADDSRMLIRRTPPEAGDYKTYGGVVQGGPIYIQIVPDEGDPPYELAERPAEKSYHTLPGLAPQRPSLSQADVLAEGVHQSGRYFVEFKRNLETGFNDDFQMVGDGPFTFSVAITNDGRGQAHYTSELLRLTLE